MDFKLLRIRLKIWSSRLSILKYFYILSNRRSDIGIPFTRYLVSEQTDAVVEGFPRSGNTWLTEFFRYKTNLIIASHIHYPFMIKDGAKFNIPVYLVIRHPLECISSLIVRDKSYTIDAALYYYRAFHNDVLSYLHQIKVISFERVTQELDVLSRELNNDHEGLTTDSNEILIFKEHLRLLEESRYNHKESALKIGLPNELRNLEKSQLKVIIEKTS